jgi:hypothetical protein
VRGLTFAACAALRCAVLCCDVSCQRGYIWGPQAQLTYWSLQNYDHVPAVRAGRKAMCKQLAGLMMSQWNQHRHICENYNPHKVGIQSERQTSS